MKINVTELRAEYPYLTGRRINTMIIATSKKTLRGLKNELRKANEEFEVVANEEPARRIEIEILWKKNRTWGMNPTATAWIKRPSGRWERTEPVSTSGCGYDKQSTVVAGILNATIRGMLWSRRGRAKRAPYGVRYDADNSYLPSFVGGVGLSCYDDVARFLGGTMEIVAESTTYDKIIFTF
jgi:hypothetical protein